MLISLTLCLATAAIAAGFSPETRRPADFVDLESILPSVQVRMMYSGSDNFVGRPIAGYKENLCLLTREAALGLKKAEARLELIGKREGRQLRFEMRDCYRPAKATKDFVSWVNDPKSTGKKDRFFPAIEKSEILKQHYLSQVSAHSRGSTMDLTIVEILPEGGSKELEMGTRVDFLGEASRTDNPDLSPEAKESREWLQEVMAPNFRNYSKEWWHFTLRNEPYPHNLFDFDVSN